MMISLHNKKINIAILSTVFLLGFVFAAQASDITEQKVIELVNDSRKKAGVSELLPNQKLDQIANLKAQDMLDNKYFAHTSPQGKTPWDWFSKGGYVYKYAGENLAIDFVSADVQHKAWMDSETHRKNILSDSFSEIGVAVASGEIEPGINSILVVQIFGKPSLLQAAQKNENFSANEEKKDWSKEKQGMILSSQKASKEAYVNLEKIVKYENIGRIVWIFLVAVSLGVLIVSPLRFVKKSYLEIFSLLEEKFKKRRWAFGEKVEKVGKKIEVRNEDEGNDESKILTVKT